MGKTSKERIFTVLIIWAVFGVMLTGLILYLGQAPYPPNSPLADQDYQIRRFDIDGFNALAGKPGTTFADVVVTIVLWMTIYVVTSAGLAGVTDGGMLAVIGIALCMVNNVASLYEEYFFIGRYLRADTQSLIDNSLVLRKLFARTLYVVERLNLGSIRIEWRVSAIASGVLLYCFGVSIIMVMFAKYLLKRHRRKRDFKAS